MIGFAKTYSLHVCYKIDTRFMPCLVFSGMFCLIYIYKYTHFLRRCCLKINIKYIQFRFSHQKGDTRYISI